MEPKRPQGRKKIVSGTTSGVHRRGSGLNTGPVGGGFGGNPGGTSPVRPSSSTPTRGARKGGISPILLILLALLVFGGGGGGLLSGLLGGGSSQTVTPAPSVSPSPSLPSAIPSALSTLLGGAAETWSSDANTAKLDTTVASSARAKRTVIYGDGRDEVTVMVYMCGTDLESRAGMATNDLMEMVNAKYSDNVHVLVYTGGCTKWNNRVVSNKKNEIYEIVSGGLNRVESDMGSVSMTKSDTLATFIKWCANNYP
ncbi:MAG: peptidase C11, partial [Oscillibacter sp.]|nr:peptidase C11 [Oscillibacter sp.]